MLTSSPTHRRRPSSISSATPTHPKHRRRSSNLSINSRRSSRAFNDEDYLDASPSSAHGFGSSIGPSQGDELGNLADELAEAWDEDEYTAHSNDSQLDGSLSRLVTPPRSPLKYDADKIRDSGIDVASQPASSPATSPRHKRHLSKAKHAKRKSRTRSIDEEILGSLEDIPRSLQICLDEIEALTRQGLGGQEIIEEEAEGPDSVNRLLASLKDVGAQNSAFETSTTRLVTAHTSLAMHLARTARSLQSLSYFLFSPQPNQHFMDEDEYDELQLSLSNALVALPQPTVEALSSLDKLHRISKESISSLSSLSDSLHMSRQVTTEAARRLKSAIEMVHQMSQELCLADEGRVRIDSGNWNQRLADREAATACRDIVSSFEATCDNWRQRLFGDGHQQSVA